jgi:hypothetical protein
VSGLGRALKRLERTDPKVGAAAKKYAETLDKILDHGTTSIETTTEPDALGRQRFAVVWWDEEQARWRGQHFFMRLDEFLNQSGNACLVAPAKRVVLRHLVEKKR